VNLVFVKPCAQAGLSMISWIYYSVDQCHSLKSAAYFQGKGLMMTSDNTYYEGHFSGISEINGKGTIHLNNGDSIVGTFDGTWSDGLKANGVYTKNDNPVSPFTC